MGSSDMSTDLGSAAMGSASIDSSDLGPARLTPVSAASPAEEHPASPAAGNKWRRRPHLQEDGNVDNLFSNPDQPLHQLDNLA